MATDYDLCFVTAPDRAAAAALADGLLQERLAACVTVLPGAESAYWWKGKIERSAETVLLIKTRSSLRGDVARFVRAHHSYENPEIIFAHIDAGSPEYLDWLGSNTRRSPAAAEKPEQGNTL